MSGRDPSERVLEYIREKYAAPSQEIATACGLSIVACRLLLAELSTRQLVRRSKRGLYRINDEGSDG